MVQVETKYPTLGQLRVEKKFKRWELEAEIRKLEKKFKATSKGLKTEGWFEIQDELGAAYRKLMSEPHDVGNVFESRFTNRYFMSKE